MKSKIEVEFVKWVEQYAGKVSVADVEAEESRNGNTPWMITFWKEDGSKDFFNYLGEGKFTFVGGKC